MLSKIKYDTIKNYFIYFIMYSIFGWCYEVFLEVVIYQWGFRNRGVLFGCWCPIYGTGALIFIILLSRFKNRSIKLWKIPITPVLMFVAITIICTLLELFGSYIMEWTTGSWMWNYEHYWMDFQGRIALNPSFRFGIGGLFFLYVLQPLFEKITKKFNKPTLNCIFYVLLTLFTCDAIYTFFIK